MTSQRIEWFFLNIAFVPFLRDGLESHTRTKILIHRNAHMILNSVDDSLMTSRELETPFRTGTCNLRQKQCNWILDLLALRRNLVSREIGCFRRNLKGMISWFIYLFLSFLKSYFYKLHWKLIQITDYAYYLEHSCQWWSTIFGSFNQNKSIRFHIPLSYLLFWISSVGTFVPIEFSPGFLCSSFIYFKALSAVEQEEKENPLSLPVQKLLSRLKEVCCLLFSLTLSDNNRLYLL